MGESLLNIWDFAKYADVLHPVFLRIECAVLAPMCLLAHLCMSLTFRCSPPMGCSNTFQFLGNTMLVTNIS